MPQETLTLPPLYCLVGAYRLAHDSLLWKPMWAKCSKAAKQAAVLGLLWLVLTWPIQKLFVHYFMSASASVTGVKALYETVVQTADVTDDNLPFRIPVPGFQTFATLTFVLGQVHAIMEFWLRRKLKECRSTAYISTVRSRGKSADWWTEYVEEFSNPPTQKAIKGAKKQSLYLKLASPMIRFFILKVFLLPMDFVPLFGMALGAAIRSLSYGRSLHKSFFEAKRMSPLQIELWVTERQFHYRSFGFFAALLERIPLIGMVFSISNQIGAAMWAHDLEKKQQSVREKGESAQIQFDNKPTLKKLYKEAQKVDHQDVPAIVEKEAQKGAPIRTDHFAGEGLAVLRSHPSKHSARTAVFTHLSFTFPLKLISPGTSSRNATRTVFQAAKRSQKLFPSPVLTKNGADTTAGTSPNDVWNDGTDNHNASVGEETSVKAVAALYVVGYGGGLISGDKVDLDVDVGHFCAMLILTQGSTKVFKRRHTRPTTTISTATKAAPPSVAAVTTTQQHFRFLIRPNATLILLPDPVTCYAASRYDQLQRFDVRCRSTSSLIVLDWITPGRTAVREPVTPSSVGNEAKRSYASDPRSAEVWAFEEYRSRNEVRVQGEVVARDILLLDQDLERDVRIHVAKEPNGDGAPTNDRTWLETELARRNNPYACYATLLLHGPDARQLIYHLITEFEKIQQRTTTKTTDLIWSLSLVERETQTLSTDTNGTQDPGLAVARIAGKTTEHVRTWLRQTLGSPQAALESVLGHDLLHQALG